MPGFNGIGWFEVGTDDPAAAQRFYGDVFGWTVAKGDPNSPDLSYQLFTTGDADGIGGGLFATKGELPNYAIFTLVVEDVEDTCRRVEKAGGTVARAPKTNPGGVTFAYLLDPAGNQFGVFTPPARP
ncbi:MAG TPA: VOC family protein [Pseudonocardiaceae bacterium]|jgi:hypothetical protein|nr:VOC family protein [Pseudonocardiaceae bacterium]